jgi:hypothetical protein
MFARTKDNIKALTNGVTFSVRDSPFYFQGVFQVENEQRFKNGIERTLA